MSFFKFMDLSPQRYTFEHLRVLLNGIILFLYIIIPDRQVKVYMCFQESDRDGEPAMAVGLLGQGPQPGMASVAIVPPTTGDDYDSDGSSGSEDEQRPLTQQELKNKILKGVSQFFCVVLNFIISLLLLKCYS